MSLEEIFVEKISALINRNKLRDLYDVYYLCRASEFSSELWVKKLNPPNIYSSDLKTKILAMKPNWFRLNALTSELPDFEVVKEFVLDKLKQFNEQLKIKK